MKKRHIIRVLSLIVVLSIASNVIDAFAATHVHDLNCYQKVVHTHDGTPTTYGGCYKGSSYLARTCGVIAVDSSMTVDKSTSNSSGGTYDITYYGICSGCGQKLCVGGYYVVYTISSGASVQQGSRMKDGDTRNHDIYEYKTSCGYNDGDYEKLTAHVHTGNPNKKAGCYTAQKLNTCNASTTITSTTKHYTSSGGGNMGTCSKCGSYIEDFEEYIECAECGHSITIIDWGSACSSCYTPPVINWSQFYGKVYSHNISYYTYELSCSLDGAYVYDDGTKAEPMCNKIIKTIAPKSKTQTVVK